MNSHPPSDGHVEKSETLLRLCLQARWRPEALEEARVLAVEHEVAWDDLVNAAQAGGVGPLLYHTTRGEDILPTVVEQKLRTDYFAAARRNILLLGELEYVLRDLENAALRTIVLKGAALAEAVYGNLAVRPMMDVDLLLPEGDVPEALRTLSAAGYRVIPPRAYRCEVMASKPGEPTTLIEVHWSLFVPFYYQYTIPVDALWTTAVPLQVGRASARKLGPEAQILHLCGHLLLHHGRAEEPRLLWLCDLAAVISRQTEQLDWDLLLRRAQAYGLVLPLQRYLPQVSDAWGAPVPIRVLQRIATLEPSETERRIVDRLSGPHQPAVERMWADLSDLPGWGPRVSVVWRNLFPPAGYLEQVYRVPHPLLVPLTYPYRWLLALRGLLEARGRRGRDPQAP